jgi:hypothetical protein
MSIITHLSLSTSQLGSIHSTLIVEAEKLHEIWRYQQVLSKCLGRLLSPKYRAARAVRSNSLDSLEDLFSEAGLQASGGQNNEPKRKSGPWDLRVRTSRKSFIYANFWSPLGIFLHMITVVGDLPDGGMCLAHTLSFIVLRGMTDSDVRRWLLLWQLTNDSTRFLVHLELVGACYCRLLGIIHFC